MSTNQFQSVFNIAMVLGISAGGLGSFADAAETPTTLQAATSRVIDVAHIYYNVISGERVITLLNHGQTQGGDTGVNEPIWSSVNRNPCSEHGYSSMYFFVVDDNSGNTSLSSSVTLSDWGDIRTDTVVDCVHVDWVTDHVDVDLNGDGVGDGVEGLAAQWTWWDGDNGREFDISTRTPLISFIFTDLLGDTTPPGDETIARYEMDVDLTASFGSSLTFEICDTDSDLQGASVHNAGIGNNDANFDGLPDSDLDGDLLADWGWSVRFFQPGTTDFDGDGFPDGDISDGFRPIGVSFGVPEGTAIDHGDGTWAWEIDTDVNDPGTGAEDAFALYFPPDANGDIHYAGFYSFGGFACEGDDGYTPPAMFEHQLFGDDGVVCCCADLNGDGVLNFFDISQFIQEFAAGEDYNGDGVTDFFDVSAFIADYTSGCQ